MLFIMTLYCRMTTVSITMARQNLGTWLKKAMHGEDIGIICDNQVVALRPVEVCSTDYALHEYDVTDQQLERFAKRLDDEIKKERKSRQTKIYSGNLEVDLAD